jgi:Domain of unknown function (DUF4136)
MKTLLLAAVLFVAGCAATLQARSDHDASQNFSHYHTFAWMADEPMVGPPGEVNRVSPLNRRRIVDAIETELRAKGFQQTPDRAAADFVVAYTVGARDRIDAQSYPAPYSGMWHWGWPYYGRDVDVRTYTEGTLAIDVFDGTTHQPVWHGWASKRVTAHDVKHAAEQIPPAVAAILKDFPPA